jgi:hypothetical protein
MSTVFGHFVKESVYKDSPEIKDDEASDGSPPASIENV